MGVQLSVALFLARPMLQVPSFTGSFSPHDPFSSFFLLPNSANNGSADTVVGKITALHFSTLSPFPPLFFSMTGGRDDVFPSKKGEHRGMERLTGVKGSCC